MPALTQVPVSDVVWAMYRGLTLGYPEHAMHLSFLVLQFDASGRKRSGRRVHLLVERRNPAHFGTGAMFFSLESIPDHITNESPTLLVPPKNWELISTSDYSGFFDGINRKLEQVWGILTEELSQQGVSAKEIRPVIHWHRGLLIQRMRITDRKTVGGTYVLQFTDTDTVTPVAP